MTRPILDLEKLIRALESTFADIRPLANELEWGRISEEVFVRKVRRLGDNPERVKMIDSAILQASGLLSNALVRSMDQDVLRTWGFSEGDLIFQPFEERPDYKMLNPLLQAAIMERAQFDGDVVEFRHGSLPPGGFPAVPVANECRDPVVLGWKLRKASEEVSTDLTRVERDVEVRKEALMRFGLPANAVAEACSQSPGVEGYRPGQRAAVRKVRDPTTDELAKLTLEERQGLAYRSLSSTQGRQSSVPAITDQIRVLLLNRDFRVASGVVASAVAEEVWTIGIDHNAREHNPRFAHIEVASQCLALKLGKALESLEGPMGDKRWWLQVLSVNDVAERRVGWRALLGKRP